MTNQTEQGAAPVGHIPEHLVLAVDRWFAENTGLGGCSDADVAALAGIFWNTPFDGGRESVEDALAVVESFGPGIQGLNDTFARQIILAAEVRRMRGLYEQAVKGRADMRDALRAARSTPEGCTSDGLSPEQEPKYTVNGHAIVNRHTGEEVPADEPIFVFRARDAVSSRALRAYLDAISEREPYSEHANAVRARIADFRLFALTHPGRMKWPDTATPGDSHAT